MHDFKSLILLPNKYIKGKLFFYLKRQPITVRSFIFTR